MLNVWPISGAIETYSRFAQRVDSLKALDPKRPIREADIVGLV